MEIEDRTAFIRILAEMAERVYNSPSGMRMRDDHDDSLMIENVKLALDNMHHNVEHGFTSPRRGEIYSEPEKQIGTVFLILLAYARKHGILISSSLLHEYTNLIGG